MKKNEVWIALLAGLLLLVPGVSPAEEHDHEHHGHHMTEIGISLGAVWMSPETETAPGIHLHFMRVLGEEGPAGLFGLGAGVEVIFSEHRHYNPMIALGFFPWKKLAITFSPGILFAREEGETHRHFSFHIEATYEFEVGNFEIGPALGYSIAGEDRHVTLGVHIGTGF